MTQARWYRRAGDSGSPRPAASLADRAASIAAQRDCDQDGSNEKSSRSCASTGYDRQKYAKNPQAPTESRGVAFLCQIERAASRATCSCGSNRRRRLERMSALRAGLSSLAACVFATWAVDIHDHTNLIGSSYTKWARLKTRRRDVILSPSVPVDYWTKKETEDERKAIDNRDSVVGDSRARIYRAYGGGRTVGPHGGSGDGGSTPVLGTGAVSQSGVQRLGGASGSDIL